MKSHPVEVDAFAAQARAFLAWCEMPHGEKSNEDFRYEALHQVATAYVAALNLPGADFRDAPEPPLISAEKRRSLAANLGMLPFQYYWEVFTPSDLDGDKEPVCGDLFDDFLDIFGDLSAGRWIFDRGHVETAVYTWRLMFGAHWGRHAVSAMHALHSFDPDAGKIRSNISLERPRGE